MIVKHLLYRPQVKVTFWPLYLYRCQGGIWTLDLKIVRRVFYHSATPAGGGYRYILFTAFYENNSFVFIFPNLFFCSKWTSLFGTWKSHFLLKGNFFGFFNFLAEKKLFALEPGNANWKGRNSTVDLRIKVACFVIKVNNVCRIESTWSKLVSTRSSTVLSFPVQ